MGIAILSLYLVSSTQAVSQVSGPTASSLKRKRRGKQSSSNFLAKQQKRHKPNDEDRRQKRLHRRMLDSATLMQVTSFRLLKEAGVTKTGWHGLPPPPLARRTILSQWNSGKIKEHLTKFTLIPYYEE